MVVVFTVLERPIFLSHLGVFRVLRGWKQLCENSE